MTRGVCSALIAGAIAVAVAAPQAHAARTSCARVEVHKRDGSSTQGVGARSIRASGTTCNEARHIARVAAKAALDKGENHLPATIDGFRIKIKVGCATCSPVWPVTATKTGAKVTFTLHGGD